MNKIYTRDEWQKVRQLSKWRDIVPTWVYQAGAIACFIAVFIDNKRSNLWVLGLVFFVAKWGQREGRERGYVDGWSEGQEYIVGHYTIDELLEEDKPKEGKETVKANKE